MPPLIKTTQPRHRPPVRPLRVYSLLLIKLVRWMCRFCWSHWYHCCRCICIIGIISTDASTWTRRWRTPRWQRGWAILPFSNSYLLLGLILENFQIYMHHHQRPLVCIFSFGRWAAFCLHHPMGSTIIVNNNNTVIIEVRAYMLV